MFSGINVVNVFMRELGKHVVQRYPKNDSGGRRHTSIINVLCLPIPPTKTLQLLKNNEIETTTMVGTGPGGQHRNRTASCVRMKHIKTGLMVVVDNKDQHQNRRDALRILTTKVNQYYNQQKEQEYNSCRKNQVNTKRGGNKVRTYNYITSRVVDHISGKKSKNLKAIMNGHFELIL